MSSASTRQQKRAPVTLKIKFKSSTLDQFVERYSVDISQGGIFIRTKSPLEVGTPLRFEFQLKNATPLITGEGTVVWTREYDPSRTGLAPGMGVRFDRLPPESQQVLTKILEQKKARPAVPQRRAAPAAVAPASEEFVDSPTKVAPRAVIAGLADTSRETFSDNEHVPVDAFEEATKVGLLDELVAKTAEPDTDMPVRSQPEPGPSIEDEPILTSAPRSDSGPIGTAVSRGDLDDDIPELPMPLSASRRDYDDGVVPPDGFGAGFDDEILDLPAPARKRPDFPDAIPTELNLSPPPPSKSPADHAPTDINLPAPSAADLASVGAKLDSKPATLLDSVPPLPDRPPAAPASAPPSAPVFRRPTADSAPPQLSKPLAATPHLLAKEDQTEIEPRGGGGSALWIAMAVGIILLAGGGFAYYTMVMKDDTATAARPAKPNNATDPNAGKQPEKPPENPPAPIGLEATVKSEVAGATASLVDGDQSGPVPMTFKGLEEGKSYKVSVTAPGFLPSEVEIKGGEESEPVELEAKPRFIAVNSKPDGAAVYIEGRRRGKTPFEIELKGPLADIDEYKVKLARSGYDTVEKTIAASDTWSEEAERMVASLDLTLNKRAVRINHVNNNSGGDGDGDGSGSGTAGTGAGTGDSGTGAGTGDTGSGSGSGDTGSGEPVPDWAKDKAKDKPKDDKKDQKNPDPAKSPKTPKAGDNTLP